MKVKELHIHNLRNHKSNTIHFADGLNIFYGLNGSGKTTIIEAIAISAFSKTFLPVQDASLIRSGESNYSIFLKAQNDYGIPYSVSIKYNKGANKEINSNLGDRLKPKEIIGEMPCVILSPDHKSITFGTPADRRDFIDKLLSQSSKKYLEQLLTFRKALRQRNNLLYQAKIEKRHDKELFETWTEILIQSGTEIVKRRIDFIKGFTPYFNDIYKFVAEGKESVSLKYVPNSIDKKKLLTELTKDDIKSAYYEFASAVEHNELRRGLTLFGPQRDDLKIYINSGLAKDTASQGQHKSLLISLKFAEYNYLRNERNETPIALLDDIFSELDKDRANKTLSLLGINYAQTFITLTNIEALRAIIPANLDYRIFNVADGIVEEEK